MKKFVLFVYVILSLGIIFTAFSWFTWGNACKYTALIPEGRSYSGMCAGDGIQFVGVFAFSLLIAIAYLGLTTIIFKAVGIKLTKR